MSRSHAFAYRFTYPDFMSHNVDGMDGWDDVIDRVHRHVCYAQQAGGGSTGDDVELWFWANRAKMRRITATLDREFATAGDVALLSELLARDEDDTSADCD